MVPRPFRNVELSGSATGILLESRQYQPYAQVERRYILYYVVIRLIVYLRRTCDGGYGDFAIYSSPIR